MKISLLLTGSELMIGSTVDSNSAFIAQTLHDLALIPFQKITVGDEMDELVQSLRYLAQKSEIIIMNGGLGPTEDDLTAEAVAKAFDLELIDNKEALAHLEKRFQEGSTKRNQSNLKQAILPVGSKIIDNPIGSAVGFIVTIKNCTIFCTPGVPSEMKLMFEDHIMPIIRKKSHPSYRLKLIRTFGCGESSLQEIINKTPLDKALTVGFRAHSPYVDVKLTAINKNDFALLEENYKKLKIVLKDYQIAEEEIELEAILKRVLDDRKANLSLAESCSGGLIASLLTSVAGASTFFQSSMVVYSNQMKMQLLDVSEETLEQFGAVSKETVLEMSYSLLKKIKSDYVLSISGIAGPTGGSPNKPVGLVWIAFGSKNKLRAQAYQFHGRRQNIQKYSAYVALDLLRRSILELDTLVPYFNFKTLNI